MSDTPYISPYIKTEYRGIIHLKNPTTGEVEEIPIQRSVYKYSSINPDLVIPAGTVIGNETTTQEMTNLDRMKQGKSPLIETYDETGKIVYDKVELHHLTSEERTQQTLFFNGEKTDGTLVEMPSSVHDKYDKQLHAINESHNSFRRQKTTTEDENGNTIRVKEKTYDAYQYDAVRSAYWKERAAEYEMQKQNGGIEMDRYQDKTPEEQRQIQQSQQNALNRWKAKTNAKKSSGEEEGKGQRERDKGQERAGEHGQGSKGQSSDRGNNSGKSQSDGKGQSR